MKANEKDFYSFYVLCHVYASFIPLVQLNVLSLSLLQSFIFFFGGGGGGGNCFNALITLPGLEEMSIGTSAPLKEVMSES